MKPTVAEIENNDRYRLLLSLSYDDIADFVLGQLRAFNPVNISFLSTCIVMLAWCIRLRFDVSVQANFIGVLPYSLAGLLLFPLLLIPVHEGIHIIVFRIMGGKDIRAGMDLKNLIFYVTAHRHVVASLPFLIIALAPLLIVSLSLMTTIWHVPPLWKWSLSLTLLAHTTMSAGDIAMASFYYLNRDKKILTYDDTDKKIAYFYHDTEN
jgi:hypothetical protein